MTRIVATVAVLCLIVGFTAWQRGIFDRPEIIKLKREKDITDAIRDCADMHWTDRLHCTDK